MPAQTLPDPDTKVGAIPDSPAALEEFLGDQKKVFAYLKENPNGFEELISNYVRVVMNRHADIQAQVDDAVQREMAAFVKQQKAEGYQPVNMNWASNMPSIPQSTRQDVKAGLYNPRAQGAQLDKLFQGPNAMSEFFSLIWHNRNLVAEDQAKLRTIRNAFSSTEGAGGGFLIPEVLRSELLRVGLESAVVRPRARIVPMESLRISFPAIDSTSNASSVHGGIISYWEEEGATHTDSSPAFQTIDLQARKLVTYTAVPNELIADSVGSLQMYISEMFPEALTFDEDYAFLTGDGAGKPLGALNTTSALNPGRIEVSAESGQAASTIYWENVIKMYSRMLPQSINRAVWVVSTDVFPELATMALSVGTGGVPVWYADGANAPQLTLMGRPIIRTEKTPAALGTVGDINFVDFGFYLVGDRQMMSVTSSEHAAFTSDKTAFKVVSRCDGKPWLNSAITPRNSSDTLSWCVQLATRS